MPRDSVSPHTRAEWSTILRAGPGYAYRHRYVPKPGGPPPPAGGESAPAGDLERVFESLAGDGWTRTEWFETLMDSRVVRWIRWTGPFLVGTLAAMGSGLLAIQWLLDYVRRHTYGVFVAYRLVVAVLVLLVILTGVREATF